jgi:polyhydroxyalkanoate synthesis regulator phasin
VRLKNAEIKELQRVLQEVRQDTTLATEKLLKELAQLRTDKEAFQRTLVDQHQSTVARLEEKIRTLESELLTF